MPRARNVLFIVADQWRGDSLGVLGHPAALTPNIDALAREGVMFTRHFGQAAPCGPARASMLTGRYVMNHRVVANGVPLDTRHTNLATAVRRAGVDPVLVGYTTTTPDPSVTPHGDPRFNELGGVMMDWRVFAHFDEVEYRAYLAWVAAGGVQLPNPPMNLWRPAEGPPGPTASPCMVPAEFSDTAWSGQHALDFLRTTRPERPWLLHLGFFRPHPPFAAPAPYHALVPDSAVGTPLRAASRAEEAAQHPILAHWLSTQKQTSYYQDAPGLVAALDDDAIRLTRRAYYGLIAEIDMWVGRVLADLRASRAWDDTLIIFTSDHGEQLGDHGLLGKLGWFDQSYHLPLVIRAPGQPGGRVVDAFTEAVDLMPTILDWLGESVPEGCDGASLLPWLAGDTPAAWRSAVHFEYDLRGGWPAPSLLPAGLSPQAGPMAAMRTQDWKYVHLTGLPPVLYDLRRDPGECRNVAADPAYRGLLAEAAQAMLTWRMLHADPAYTNLVASPAGLVARALPSSTSLT